MAAVLAVITPVSCALTVSYDGYDRAGDDGKDAGAGSGGLGGCFPLTCGSLGAECGTVPDGCGSKIDCEACGGGKICSKGKCFNQSVCGNSQCEPGESCATCAPDCTCGSNICLGDSCCVPDCTGKICGPDGCGKLCGAGPCPAQQKCEKGACVPAANCGNGTCAEVDAETCENCIDCPCNGNLCLNEQCCSGSCEGKECGTDGCGVDCGMMCPAGKVCDMNGQCQNQATCGNTDCETGEDCSLCVQDCPCMPPLTCSFNGSCCMPDCAGKACGSDGCGSICGTCAPSQTCDLTGKCVGCGDSECSIAENCTSCPSDCGCQAPNVCNGTVCCMPSCAGKNCGPDNCGNPTGCGPPCPTGQSCINGSCQLTVGCGDTSCNNGETCATCPGDCPTPAGKKCCPGGIIHACCEDTDCFSDPSTCNQGYCNTVVGTCGVLIWCQFPDCCNFGNCEDCGGSGGFSGFGGGSGNVQAR